MSEMDPTLENMDACIEAGDYKKAREIARALGDHAYEVTDGNEKEKLKARHEIIMGAEVKIARHTNHRMGRG